jgi:hypothetical protein
MIRREALSALEKAKGYAAQTGVSVPDLSNILSLFFPTKSFKKILTFSDGLWDNFAEVSEVFAAGQAAQTLAFRLFYQPAALESSNIYFRRSQQYAERNSEVVQ